MAPSRPLWRRELKAQPMTDSYTMFSGRVSKGFQFASGSAVGRAEAPSPYPYSTLRMQHRHFLARGFDMTAEVPGLLWATINVRLDGGQQLALGRADRTLELVDWTADYDGVQIPPETFSFVRCCLANRGRFHLGLIYYPHPGTKPATNSHDYGVLEVLSGPVHGVQYGDEVSLMCRSDGFQEVSRTNVVQRSTEL